MNRSSLTLVVMIALLPAAAFAQAPATATKVAAAKPAAAHVVKAPLAKATPATRIAQAPRPAARATPTTQAPRTPKSIACSKSADGKGLHGKPREQFMSNCNRGA